MWGCCTTCCCWVLLLGWFLVGGMVVIIQDRCMEGCVNIDQHVHHGNRQHLQHTHPPSSPPLNVSPPTQNHTHKHISPHPTYPTQVDCSYFSLPSSQKAPIPDGFCSSYRSEAFEADIIAPIRLPWQGPYTPKLFANDSVDLTTKYWEEPALGTYYSGQ